MKGELADSKRELELRDKELMEAKDRMTALENQIEEYAGTIDDQYRVSIGICIEDIGICIEGVHVHVHVFVIMINTCIVSGWDI